MIIKMVSERERGSTPSDISSVKCDGNYSVSNLKRMSVARDGTSSPRKFKEMR